jgi:hypothetical protein
MNTRIGCAEGLGQVFRGLSMVAGALVAVSATAVAQSEDARLVDSVVARQIVVTIDPRDRTASDSMVVRVGGRMSRAVTAYRFRVETPGPVVANAAWKVTLYSGASRAEPMSLLVGLSADAPDIQLPRPYGVQLDAYDSLVVVATMRDGDMRALPALRITVDYESADEPARRIGVVSLPASQLTAARVGELVAGNDKVVRAWTWMPAIGGRMVAITGRQLAGAEEVVLEDEATGEVLWSMRAETIRDGATIGSQRDVIRPSVALRAGRTYRLAARFAMAIAAGSNAGREAPMAVMLPARHR